MRHQLGPVVKFTYVTFYQPAVDELSASVVDSNTALAVSMTAAWSLTASWRERFDSEARERGAITTDKCYSGFGSALRDVSEERGITFCP